MLDVDFNFSSKSNFCFHLVKGIPKANCETSLCSLLNLIFPEIPIR